jgi:hypothetical protein
MIRTAVIKSLVEQPNLATNVVFQSFPSCKGNTFFKNIQIYIQQDATLNSLFYLETVLNVSGGKTTHHQERKQLHLQHLIFVTPLLLSASIAA